MTRPMSEEERGTCLFDRLYNALSAAEALNICNEGPALNRRGVLLLRYLQERRAGRRLSPFGTGEI